MKSFKGLFPFKLATTSYIYPDRILPNVARLAPFLDEMELVLFESNDLDNYPDPGEIKDLKDLSLSHGVGYHVHLPIDIYLGEGTGEIRLRGVTTVKKVIERTLCLNPSFYTLHFEWRTSDGRAETDLEVWRKRLIQSVREIMKSGIESNRISIETLDYPFEWLEDIVTEFGFSICLDIGHLLISGRDLRLYLERYLPKTSIVHLHGFADGSDHLGIDRLPQETLEWILSRLRNYRSIVSIEVFSFDDLVRSLILLEEKWGKR
ncbi:MAG: cobamide remodeling phosphodiesterase CbiR [Thermodesulfobacteriota bacterium]